MKSPLNIPAALQRARRALAATTFGTEAYMRAAERVADFEAMVTPEDQIDEFPQVHTETRETTTDVQRKLIEACST